MPSTSPVSDFDAAYRRARDAGATITREPYTTTFGSRNFVLTDPEGGKWYLGTNALGYMPAYPLADCVFF
ncbi:g10558 [Coccomyxa viridis]|uniref:G10558 protein n=1 Tax=Coccomyxa viridis TaxID=1274662 RepID=A0ABP1G8E2_9CHLO